MAEIKDRRIRINNIPKSKVRFRLTSKPILMFLLIGLGGILLVNTDANLIGYFIVIVAVFLLIFTPNETRLAYYDNFLVYYFLEEKDMCLIIYYNEVKSWRYEKNIGREAYFLIGTNDEARYEINVANPKKALPWFRHFLKDQEVS
ncbi:MAG: hypothetical protein WC907_07085 [Acholeplasmataceae bacterium]